jgi:hypothetical protein
MTTTQSEPYIDVVDSFSQVMLPVKTFSVGHWSLLIKQLFLEREVQIVLTVTVSANVLALVNGGTFRIIGRIEGWTPKDTHSTQDEPSWYVLYWKAGRAPDSGPVP